MARIVNFLPRNNALMTTDDNGRIVSVADFSHDWTTTNSVATLVSSDFVVNTRYTLRIAPSSSGAVVITLQDIPLAAADNEKTISFNAKMKGVSSFRTSTKLFVDGDDSSVEANIQTLSGGEYNAIHSNNVLLEPEVEPRTFSVEITVTNHSTGTLFLTLPHVIDDYAFYENFFIRESLRYFPDFYWDIDRSQVAPRYPFFKWVNSLVSAAGDTRNEYDAIFGYESEELRSQDQKVAYWGSSTLVSPSHVREEYIPWLGQFTGHNVTRNFTVDGGALYFNNIQLERDFIEWQLRNSFYGRGAGTRRAMIEAARQVLVRTKDNEPSTRSVALTPKFGGDPFAIRIQTLTNETYDANEDESSNLVLKSVNMAKPMGYKVTHNTVDEFFFTIDDLTLGVIGEQRVE